MGVPALVTPVAPCGEQNEPGWTVPTLPPPVEPPDEEDDEDDEDEELSSVEPLSSLVLLSLS
jgi:hypothetical protein